MSSCSSWSKPTIKTCIRLLAFFGKEINELRRQPKLVLSLLLGPLLIVLLFGIGFEGEPLELQTILVTPQESMEPDVIARLKEGIAANFTLVEETGDLDAALARLQAGDVDVVVILPADVEKQLMAGRQVDVDFRYRQINPLDAAQIRYRAYAQVVELNRAIQARALGEVQAEVDRRELELTIPAETLVSPLRATYQNTEGETLDLMTFYAPSVLALVLQHIAVTLAALSLVRERLLGAFELFQVAPVTLLEVLLGKYAGYTLFVAIIAVVLVALMGLPPLSVPFLGSYLLFGGFVLLFTLASLGIGFLISAWASSDSQAIQVSMLVLLMSIFFGGFFLPLENFRPAVQAVGFLLPLTHAIKGFHAIMLGGTAPSTLTWLALAMIAGVTCVLARRLARRRLRSL